MTLPSWVPEIETKPAPMPLLLVQSFVNTYEADTGVDVMEDLEGARRWLADAGLLGDGVLGEDDLAQVRDVRESLRTLLVQNAGAGEATPDQRAPLTVLAGLTRMAPSVASNGDVTLAADEDEKAVRLGGLLLIVRDAQRDGTWTRLKACRNDECLWAFYDRSHAGRGAWCDMNTCGNRIKNRNLRARRSVPT